MSRIWPFSYDTCLSFVLKPVLNLGPCVCAVGSSVCWLSKICVVASALFCAPCTLIRSTVSVDFFLDIIYGKSGKKT